MSPPNSQRDAPLVRYRPLNHGLLFPVKAALCELLAVMLIAQAVAQPANDPNTNSLGMRMIPVRAGSFTMGSTVPDDNWNERPAHPVTIRHGFLMSESEVTLAQFRQFRPGFEGTPGCDPYVAGVSWIEATAFCDWLSQRVTDLWPMVKA